MLSSPLVYPSHVPQSVALRCLCLETCVQTTSTNNATMPRYKISDVCGISSAIAISRRKKYIFFFINKFVKIFLNKILFIFHRAMLLISIRESIYQCNCAEAHTQGYSPPSSCLQENTLHPSRVVIRDTPRERLIKFGS